MARLKIKRLFVLGVLAALMAAPCAASAYTVYDGNISSTYTTIFRDVVANKGINDDYLYFRSDQNDYVLLIGDLTYDSGMFTADEAKEYKITTNANYSGRYDYTVSDVRSVNLIPGTALVYSNLGDFPELVEAQTNYLFVLQLTALICLAMCLFHGILDFCLRGKIKGDVR